MSLQQLRSLQHTFHTGLPFGVHLHTLSHPKFYYCLLRAKHDCGTFFFEIYTLVGSIPWEDLYCPCVHLHQIQNQSRTLSRFGYSTLLQNNSSSLGSCSYPNIHKQDCCYGHCSPQVLTNGVFLFAVQTLEDIFSFSSPYWSGFEESCLFQFLM